MRSFSVLILEIVRSCNMNCDFGYESNEEKNLQNINIECNN